MGIPYHKKNVNCITVVVDAEQNDINTLCGKIGKRNRRRHNGKRGLYRSL